MGGIDPNEHSAPGRTHADQIGDGRPRLVVSQQSGALVDVEPDGALHTEQVKSIEAEIGSSLSVGGGVQDGLRLEGLPTGAFTVRLRRDDDEFIVLPMAAPVRVDGGPVDADGRTLRTGDRITVGDWELSFAREEFADHGRPHGGRQGGELARQDRQDPPPGDA